MEAINRAADTKTPTVVLYNYPSFSGAFSALFAHLFHSHLHLPCLILPFSSVVPFRVEDLCFEGLKTCYFLDFIGPKGFSVELQRRTACNVISFDHRKETLAKIPPTDDYSGNLTFHVDVGKSSSWMVYDYFSRQLRCTKSSDGNDAASSLLNSDDQCRMELLLNYLEDGDLRQWKLPDIRAFNIGISEWRSNLNCITNPHMYEQGVRADTNPDISDEIGKELSIRSAAAGLRPIGAVVFMQRKSLKVCLRSTDGTTDTSEIAKAYGGGGSPSSSSFIIKMDEYNQWRTDDISSSCTW